jgi:hypothetical protein
MSIIDAEASPLLLSDKQSLQERARDLLSVAECVTREGWGDTVAAHLRQAAQDLLRLASPKEPAC